MVSPKLLAGLVFAGGIIASVIAITQFQYASSSASVATENNSSKSASDDAWKNRYLKLRQQYFELKDKYEALTIESQVNANNAQSLQSSLDHAQSELAISAKPPYTLIHGRQVYLAFKDSQHNQYQWTLPIDSYRAIVESPRPEEGLELRNPDTGKIHRVKDFRPFVSTSTFSKVADRLYDNAGSDYQFVYESWYIASQLATYSADIGEQPRYATETLVEAGGDCEDLAILIASILRASFHTSDWKIQFVIMDSDNPTSPQATNHVMLRVETSDFVVYIEPTAKADGLSIWDWSVKGWRFDV